MTTATDPSALATNMRGPVLTAADSAFGEVRQVWNGMFDRRPGFIARCLSAADVIAAALARDELSIERSKSHDHQLPRRVVETDPMT